MISPNDTQQDRTYSCYRMPLCTFLPAPPTRPLVLPEPSSRKAVAISGPILSIVRPCFGQNGIECGT